MLSPFIHEIHKKMEEQIDGTRLLVHMHAHEYQLLNKFIQSLGRPNDVNGTYTDLGFTDGSLKGLIIQMHLEKTESFKAGTPIIEWLLSRGFVQEGNDENADWGYRAVTLKKIETAPPLFWPSHHEWKSFKLTATLRMWPHPEGQNCKKVEAGQETKFKFVCEEVA